MPDSILIVTESHERLPDGSCHRVAWLGTPDSPRVLRLPSIPCTVATVSPDILREWRALAVLAGEAMAADYAAFSLAYASDAQAARSRQAAASN